MSPFPRALLALASLTLPAQTPRFTNYIGAFGIGVEDARWGNQERVPDTGYHSRWGDGHKGYPILTSSLMLGAEGAYSPRTDWRAALSATFGCNNFVNAQASLVGRYAFLSKYEREFYGVLGPTVNCFSGNYTLREGYVPPYGHGEARHVSQFFMPGLKLGLGFQFSRRWSVEVDADGILAQARGRNGIGRSLTGYVEIVMALRLGRVEPRVRPWNAPPSDAQP